jgi:hypothetical protein
MGETIGNSGISLSRVSHAIVGFVLNDRCFHGILQVLGGLWQRSDSIIYGLAASLELSIMTHALGHLKGCD